MRSFIGVYPIAAGSHSGPRIEKRTPYELPVTPRRAIRTSCP